MEKDLHPPASVRVPAGCSVAVPALRRAHQCILISALSAKVKTDEVYRDSLQPVLRVSTVVVITIGVFVGRGCWGPLDLFFSHGKNLWPGISFLVSVLAHGCTYGYSGMSDV